MIAAIAALQLPNAKPSKDDIDDCRALMEKLDDHVRKHMAFGGPPSLEVPFREASKTAIQILVYAMKSTKWAVSANLIAEQPRFAGGQPVPHHWVLQLQPMVEVYDEIVAAALSSLLDKPLLDA